MLCLKKTKGHFVNFNFFMILTLISVITSCFQKKQEDFYTRFNIPETTGKEIFDGEVEPLRPPLELGMETLLGIDANNNGVRDDVEIWINRKFDDPLKRMGYKKLYKVDMEKAELAIKESIDDLFLKNIESELARGTCVYYWYSHEELHVREKDLKDFHQVIVNTRLRQDAHTKVVFTSNPITRLSEIDERLDYLKRDGCEYGEKFKEQAIARFKKRVKMR